MSLDHDFCPNILYWNIIKHICKEVDTYKKALKPIRRAYVKATDINYKLKHIISVTAQYLVALALIMRTLILWCVTGLVQTIPEKLTSF